MKLNRFVSIAFIIGTSIFASYFGGNISYALFYLSILIPVVSFAYTYYVYRRFKIYQSIKSHTVIKGDWNPYTLIVANEDFLTYCNIKVNFLKDKSVIEDTEDDRVYSLLPGEQSKFETKIKCNYRGRYVIGVDSIDVTDFLFLFEITYPLKTRLNMVVYPRIIELKSLIIAPEQIDFKYPVWFNRSPEDELDAEVRKYNPGDNIKQIHWNASARHQELLSRKYQPKPDNQIILFMDLVQIKEDDLLTVIIEDKIIESVIAISNFYASKNIAVRIIYNSNGKKDIRVTSKEEWGQFYQDCALIEFDSKVPISVFARERAESGDRGNFYVLVSHILDKETYLAALKIVSMQNHLAILLISNDLTDEMNEKISSLKEAGVKVIRILPEDEIEDILS